MNYKEFQTHKQRFESSLRRVLSEYGKDAQVIESGVCPYVHSNPLIRFLFWRRVWVAIKFLELHGPYEAVLDFGCGSGVILPLLTGFANRVVGVDTNLSPYRVLSCHLSFPDGVEVYETKEQPLSRFPDKTFDVIVALDALEHVGNLRDVLAELCRIIKRDGMVVISGPTENLFYRSGRLQEKSTRENITSETFTMFGEVRSLSWKRRHLPHCIILFRCSRFSLVT